MAFKFIKTGAESAQLAQKQKQAQEALIRRDTLYRFWLKPGEEARITFVDGDLVQQEHGGAVLCPPRYYEHNLFLNGVWNNFFVCPERTNPDANDSCPLCEGNDRPVLVALFTIIDHRQFTSTKDPKKVYKDTKKLLVVKPHTFETLNKAAIKRGGLVGCTFDTTRADGKSAAVGNNWEFVEKHPIEVLKAIHQLERVDPKTNQKKKETYFTIADYEKEIVYRTGDELRKLGLGGKFESGFSTGGSAQSEVDYSGQL